MAIKYTTRILFGIANSEELKLSKEELYDVVYRVTGKSSISKLTQKQLEKCCNELSKMKDRVKKKSESNGKHISTKQKAFIEDLETKLGWDDNTARLRGFIKKYAKTDDLRFCTRRQASNIIEALKRQYTEKVNKDKFSEESEERRMKMAIKINDTWCEDNLEKRVCENCERQFIIGIDTAKDLNKIYCPYCSSTDNDGEVCTDDEILEDMEMGCLGIYYEKK